jgi:hypothetical protein
MREEVTWAGENFILKYFIILSSDVVKKIRESWKMSWTGYLARIGEIRMQ